MARLCAGTLDRLTRREIEIEVFDRPGPAPVPVQEAPSAAAPRSIRQSPEKPVAVLPRHREAPTLAPPPPAPFGINDQMPIKSESAVALPLGQTMMTPQRASTPLSPSAGRLAVGFSPETLDRIVGLPEVIDDIEAVYPVQAERDAIEGSVVLEVDVDREGKVRGVRVLRGAGHGMDENAVRALWKARFKPARNQDGLAVDCRIRHTVHFQPAKSEQEEAP